MRRILAVLALGAIVMVGCGDDSDDTPEGAAGGDTTTTAADTTEVAADAPVEPAVLDVTSAEFGYELSTAEVSAGPVQVNQTNAGELEHQVTIIGLDGMTPDELVTTIAEEGDDALDPAVFAGGPNTVGPGEANTALVQLEAGEYVAYCFLPDHAAQGMVEPFTVTGEAPAEVAAPEAASTIELVNFGFEVPAIFDGRGTIEVVNNGDQAHELTILDADDQTGQGGLTTTGPGTTGYVDIDLAPGDYTFVCFVTDPASGQIHLQLGMEQPVTIT